MKKLALILSLCLTASSGFTQGIVHLLNSPSTLISIYPSFSAPVPIAGGVFYFGLFTAPLGTTEPLAFTFSGLYATNLPAAGRFFGGIAVEVPGWAPAESRSFLVRGWESYWGHDWNPDWLTPGFDSPIFPGCGTSEIGSGMAGGLDPATGLPYPALNIFGPPDGIQEGFYVVPEPSTFALLALGMAAVSRRLMRRKKA